MGLPAGLRRLFFSAEDQDQRAILVSTILRGGLLFALLATALSLIFGPILLGTIPEHFPDFFPYFAYAIIYQIWYQFLDYRLALYQVRGRAKLYANLQFIIGLAIFCSVILQVVYLNKGAEGFLLGRVVAVGVGNDFCPVFTQERYVAGMVWQDIFQYTGFFSPIASACIGDDSGELCRPVHPRNLHNDR